MVSAYVSCHVNLNQPWLCSSTNTSTELQSCQHHRQFSTIGSHSNGESKGLLSQTFCLPAEILGGRPLISFAHAIHIGGQYSEIHFFAAAYHTCCPIQPGSLPMQCDRRFKISSLYVLSYSSATCHFAIAFIDIEWEFALVFVSYTIVE